MRRRKIGLNLSALSKHARRDFGEYTPLRGRELISIMVEGHSLTVAACKMGVSLPTLYEWAKQYPEFAEALNRGEGLLVYYLEKQLSAARDMRTVKATIRALKQACPEEYGDRKKNTPPPGTKTARLQRRGRSRP